MLSDSPPEKDLEWTDTGINGSFKYLNKLWNLVVKNKKSLSKKEKSLKNFKYDNQIIEAMNKTIHFVTLDYENFRFNRAIARIRELTNILFENEEKLKKNIKLFKFFIENIVKIAAPIIPHISEEIWRILGNKTFLIQNKWPVADQNFLKIENIILAVQINGKLRETINLPINTSSSVIEKKVLALSKIKKVIEGKKPKKIIVVKNRVANIVI